jgi:sporulation protein YlmC with PRC-barrel domain
MSKESSKLVPAERFVGMQVIDSKGLVVGNVKDVSLDFQNKAFAFHVTTKNRTELDMGWDDVSSVQDVVLLKKSVDLPAETVSGSSAQQLAQALVLCPKCGASTPNVAKFCPKCGANLK